MTFSNKRIEAAHNAIIAAEYDLATRFTAGQARDLMLDTFQWIPGSKEAGELLKAIDVYGFDEWTPRTESAVGFPEINGMNLADVTEALNLANTNGRDGSFLKPEYRADFVARVAALEERRRRLVATNKRIQATQGVK